MYNVAKTAQPDEVLTSNAHRGPRKNTISTCAHLTMTDDEKAKKTLCA